MKQGFKQIEAGNPHGPAAQQRPLRNHQIADHIAPAKVIRIRLVRGGFIISGQDPVQPVPDHQASFAVEAGRLIEIIQKSEPAVQEEKRRGQQYRPLPGRHLPGQHHDPRIAQEHHKGSGKDKRNLQAASEKIEGGAQAVRQKGIAQPVPRKKGIIHGILLSGQPGDEAHMHGQIPVGALTHIPVSVSVHPHPMGILQIAAQQRKRQNNQQHLPQKYAFLPVPSFGRFPASAQPADPGEKTRQAQRKPMGGFIESRDKSYEGWKAHLLQQAEAHSQPDSVQNPSSGKQPSDAQHAERLKNQKNN